MEEFKVGSLLLAALFGLPGFLFIQILAKFCFSSTRAYGGRSLQVFASFAVSTVLIYFFDSHYVHAHIPTCFDHLGIFSADYIDFITNTPLSGALFGYIFSDKRPRDLSHLVGTLVFIVTLFSVICAVAIAVFINLLEWYSKTDFSDHFATAWHFCSYFFRRLLLLFDTKKKRIGRFRKKLGPAQPRSPPAFNIHTPITYGNWFYLFPFKVTALIGAAILALGLLVLLVIALALVLIFTTFNLASEFVLFVFHKILDMFRHPAERNFEPHKFGWRGGVPIVEILSGENRINKGRLIAFQPKNSEELLSVTITNVIQYNKVSETPFFDRGERQVYEFPNRNSRLTIGFKSIKDINVSYMKFSDFGWQFKIIDTTSIRNQLWYLKILLEKHRARFGFDKFNAWIDSRHAPLFFLELLLVLESSYVYFFYGYKLKRLTKQLRSYFRPYRLDLKKNFKNLPADAQADVLKAKSALATALWRLKKTLPR